MKDLECTGFVFCDKVYTVTLAAVICDAPACAFVKSHTGYNSCE